MGPQKAIPERRHTVGKIVRLRTRVRPSRPTSGRQPENGTSIMRALLIASVSQVALVAIASLASAQDRSDTSPTAAPGVVIEGSGNTSIGVLSPLRAADWP